MSNRIGVFVDVGNQFFYANKKWPGKKINYQRYYDQAETLGHIQRAFAFGTQIDNSAAKFAAALTHIGFECRYRDIDRGKWYSWDVGMAMEMVRCCEKLDVVVLGTSNYTMAHVVKYLRDQGVKVIIMACTIPKELRDVADQCIEVTERMLENGS